MFPLPPSLWFNKRPVLPVGKGSAKAVRDGVIVIRRLGRLIMRRPVSPVVILSPGRTCFLIHSYIGPSNGIAYGGLPLANILMDGDILDHPCLFLHDRLFMYLGFFDNRFVKRASL